MGSTPSTPVATFAFTKVHMLLCMGKITTLHGLFDGKGRDWSKINTKAGGHPFQLSTKGAEIAFDYGQVVTTREIASSTNANPIVLTVFNHGFDTGDTVIVANHLLNTPANGTWTITKVDANRFSVPVAGSAVGGATGTASKTVAKSSAPLKNISALYSDKWFLGENVQSMTPLEIDVEVEADNTVGDPLTGMPLDDAGLPMGVNPACVYWPVLTDPQWGARIPSTALNLVEFQKAWTIYKNEGICLEFLLESGRSAREILKQLNFHTRSIIRTGKDGRLELYPLRSYNYTAIPITEQEMKDFNPGLTTWDEVYNEFIGSYPERRLRYTQRATAPEKNEAVIQMTGRRRTVTYDFEWFTDIDQVTRRLTALKNEGSYPTSAIKFTAPKKFHAVRVGDVFSVTHSLYGYSNTQFRVAKRKDADFGKQGIEFECSFELSFAAETAYTPVTISNWKPAVATPLDPIDVSALAHYWGSHVSFPDALGSSALVKSGKTGRGYKTHVFANRGSDLDTAFRLSMFYDVQTNLPVTSAGAFPEPVWAYRFSLNVAVDATYRYCNELPVDLILRGFSGQDFDLDNQSATDANGYQYQCETSQWCMIVGGKEVWRWKTVQNLGGGVYRFQGVLRGANLERPAAWPVGTEVWVARLSEPVLADGSDYNAWPHRQRYADQTDHDSNNFRFKAYLQSIFHLGEIQDETEGLVKVLEDQVAADPLARTNLYSTAAVRAPQLPPMVAAQAWKKGDTPSMEFMSWYAFGSPASGDWVIEFQPLDVLTSKGAGLGIVYDTGEKPSSDLLPPDWETVGTDDTYANIAVRAELGQVTYKLEIFRASQTTPVRTKTIAIDHTNVSETWKSFIYTAAEFTTDVGIDPLLTADNVRFEVSAKEPNKQDAYNRAIVASKLGWYPNG